MVGDLVDGAPVASATAGDKVAAGEGTVTGGDEGGSIGAPVGDKVELPTSFVPDDPCVVALNTPTALPAAAAIRSSKMRTPTKTREFNTEYSFCPVTSTGSFIGTNALLCLKETRGIDNRGSPSRSNISLFTMTPSSDDLGSEDASTPPRVVDREFSRFARKLDVEVAVSLTTSSFC